MNDKRRAKVEFQVGWGDGRDIVAAQDPSWLRKKQNFCVDSLHIYEGREKRVPNLFYPGTITWDERRVSDMFSVIDAEAILAIPVPQHDVGDR